MPALDDTLAAIDAANGDDPRKIVVEGTEHPFEIVYAERMSARLGALYPNASDLLKIATRAQHLRRFDIARGDYPDGKRGYDDWRRACRVHHATLAGDIIRAHGYGDDAVAHVGMLIRKEHLKKDAESQALENVAALVFVEHYFQDFLEKHKDYADEKLVDILGKTLRKMSPKGLAAALALPLPDRVRALVAATLAREAEALKRLAAVAVEL
jgi:hypothetical protein